MQLLIAENPHVYSPVSGFVAEYKFRELFLTRPEITDIVRPSGYDKQKKGDFVFTYRGQCIRVEVKSLDGPKVRDLGGDQWAGTFQCNASDARLVELPNGNIVHTNCIVAGGWDVLAVSMYDFGRTWRFGFALQDALPRGSGLYSLPDGTRQMARAEDRPFLLASSMPITFPLMPPYTSDFIQVLDAVVAARTGLTGPSR